MITKKELIKKFIEFYKSKNHKEIPNASLVPENDPTVLFTTAGMHPLVPYLAGQPHPLGKRLCNVQKCIRTQDIEEVGDTYHHTFFEMLGKWSIGDYFKKEAIEYTFEFYTKILKIPIERLAVTCFKGDKNAPKDEEAAEIWKSLGIPEKRIAFLPASDNWWGPAGKTGPCGPSTESFYWKPNKISPPKKFDTKNKNWVEIGNDVLMQYNKNEKAEYNLAKQKNIDFGGGVERTVTILNGLEDDYLSDNFKPIIEKMEKLSGKNYEQNEKETKAMRIIADHLKASVFIISNGVTPSNTEQGYVLRRLIRRVIRYGKEINIYNFTSEVAKPIFQIYDDYPELTKNKKQILQELEKEEEKFNLTLEKGMKVFEKITSDKHLSGKNAFLLYQSYGFPIEMTKELAREKSIKLDEKSFQQEFKKHQDLSKTASAGKFKSGLADDSMATTRLHTAAHLLLSALKKVLGDDKIIQKGSNITAERLRLDFSFPRKLNEKEIKDVENLVNAQIQKSIEIIKEEMAPEKAKQEGATGTFDKKYGDIVSVYTIGDFSKEICTGPHAKNTKELGKFKIKKESSSSSGVRRIKAVLE